MPKSIYVSLLTLLPKVDNPHNLSGYRPISLVGSLYKILEKVLANRINRVISKLVSRSQTSFVPGRKIIYEVLVLNELID